MKIKNNFNIFYIHTPKTAGTSVNEYFTNIFKRGVTHVEGRLGRNPNFDINAQRFVSGHLSYSRVRKLVDPSWQKIITFREPYSFVISHLCWIRLLADEDQADRFQRHPKVIQKVASKMTEYDFSLADDITSFINWLDKIDYNYLHNTQTVYVDADKNIERAFDNLNDIEFVGTLERIDEFLGLVNNQLSLGHDFNHAPRVNVNSRKYGFDVSDEATRKALYPLIDKDIRLYEAATKRLDRDLLFSKSPVEIGKERGVVDYISNKLVSGWAFSRGSGQHLTLELYIGGKKYGETVSNLFRVGIKERGQHRTGCVGFKFDIDLSEVDFDKTQVEVRSLVSGKAIKLAKRLA